MDKKTGQTACKMLLPPDERRRGILLGLASEVFGYGDVRELPLSDDSGLSESSIMPRCQVLGLAAAKRPEKVNQTL